MIKSLSHYLESHRREFALHAELAKYNCWRLGCNGEGLVYNLGVHPELSLSAKKMLLIPFTSSERDEIYLTVCLARDGICVFQPTQFQLEMMEEMTLNIEAQDYVQPFPTLIIELPEQYHKKKLTHLPQEGQMNLGHVMGSDHEPLFVIINHAKFPEHDAVSIICATVFSSGYSIKTTIALKNTDILEEKAEITQLREDGVETTQEEFDIHNQCIRAALNYCLLVDEIGAKKIGPSNPSYYNRLLKYKSKALKENDRTKLANINNDLRRCPLIYTIDQEVNLCKVVSSPSELPNDTDSNGYKRSISPHRRRGYYRQQPYGPNNSLRYRLRIPATIVHREQFVGQMIDARSIYYNK